MLLEGGAILKMALFCLRMTDISISLACSAIEAA